MKTPDKAPLRCFEPIRPDLPNCAKTEEDAEERAVAALHRMAWDKGHCVDPESIHLEYTLPAGVRASAYFLTPEQLERSA